MKMYLVKLRGKDAALFADESMAHHAAGLSARTIYSPLAGAIEDLRKDHHEPGAIYDVMTVDVPDTWFGSRPTPITPESRIERLNAAIDFALDANHEPGNGDALEWLRDWRDGDAEAMAELEQYLLQRQKEASHATS
ncbi:hypothetical protein [Ferrovibrio sp.]|uniref:hypothetical protein n=1 Tax=Ferrovibrio sp. TaxID=1917215 RepID=UPI003D13F36A